MSFADLADSIPDAPPPRQSFADLADSIPTPAAAPAKKVVTSPAPKFQTNDPAAFREQIRQGGDTGLLAAFDAQFPNLAKPSAGAGRGFINPPLASAPQPLRTLANGIPAAPGANFAPTPDAPESMWDKVKGVGEAAASTVGAIPAGLAGSAANIYHTITSGPQAGDQAGNDTMRAVQNWMTAGPMSQAGQRYAGNVGEATADLPAVAPLSDLATLGRISAPSARQSVGDVLGSGSSQLSSLVKPPAAMPTRIEPTMVKPLYRMVDGQWKQVDGFLPIEGANNSAAPLPGAAYQPTVQTASPGLQQAVQEAQRGRQPINQAVLTRHLEADSLPVPMTLTKGQALQDPTIISEEMNNRKNVPEIVNALNAQGKQLGANVDAIRQSAAPDVTAANHVENGQALIDSYKNMDAPVTADISAKYKALSDANGGQLPLNGQDFVKAADAALSKQMKGRYVPPEVQGDLESFRQGGPMTFEDFENLRTNLAEESRKAERAPRDGNAAVAINIVRNTLESLPMSDETAAIKPLADAARGAAKARFDKIRADPAYAAAVGDSTPIGELSPLADNFISNHVIGGKVANVARMKQNLANDPLAGQTIAAGAMNYLKAKAGADPLTGNFSQAGYNGALGALSPKLDLLFEPQTAQQVQALGNVAKYTQSRPTGSYVNSSNTGVGFLVDKGKTVAEKLGNMAVPGAGLGTDAMNYLARRSMRNSLVDHLKPGAGLTALSNLAQK